MIPQAYVKIDGHVKQPAAIHVRTNDFYDLIFMLLVCR